MLNYKSITPRNISETYLQRLEKKYPHHVFNDVMNYSPNKDVIVGISGLDKELPILQTLTNRENFSLLLNGL